MLLAECSLQPHTHMHTHTHTHLSLSCAALPIQLASKLTPEMEARDAELIAALEASVAAESGVAAGGGGAGAASR